MVVVDVVTFPTLKSRPTTTTVVLLGLLFNVENDYRMPNLLCICWLELEVGPWIGILINSTGENAHWLNSLKTRC